MEQAQLNKLFRKHKITARKSGGDDYASWCVFLNGRPIYSGLARREVSYYKEQVLCIALGVRKISEIVVWVRKL